MTKLLYLTDTYLFTCDALILSVNQDDKGLYVLLNQTIFYPQGGGQPSDQGFLEDGDFRISVTSVRQIENEIRHYIQTESAKNLENLKVNCTVDRDRRLLNACYHTAGHLLSNIVEKLYPPLKAIKGHSFPNEAYVKFEGEILPEKDKIQEWLNKFIGDNLQTAIIEIDSDSFENKFYKLPYKIPSHKLFRILKIGNFLPVPCGGTHIKSLKEIDNMHVSKIKSKNNIVRISYELPSTS